ncbi:hypothetical protein BT96DRAFT_945217 [Gymnopus androsaceus JB14]|uniref:non-specific serine/threonine protein kinase n=1 Tax=Gymnopus androsaceus JB14 TaxID=1447944 RepID=A0A6A4H2N6_9AGAR|nr:hypothetical protein BT96DRAFT_945217 [Gymnopus androsaceus JB14]
MVPSAGKGSKDDENTDVIADYMEIHEVEDPTIMIGEFLIRQKLVDPDQLKSLAMILLITARHLNAKPFKLQPRLLIASRNDPISAEALNPEFEANLVAFNKSWKECQKHPDLDPPLPSPVWTYWESQGLLPYLNLAFDLTVCMAPNLPMLTNLMHNGVLEWTKPESELPISIKDKKARLEAKQIWSDWPPEDIMMAQHTFRQVDLPISDFAVWGQTPDLSPVHSRTDDFAALDRTKYTNVPEYIYLSTARFFTIQKPHIRFGTMGSQIFEEAGAIAVNQSPNAELKFYTQHQTWPGIEFLYFTKHHANIDDSVFTYQWEKQMLCSINPKSDTALFNKLCTKYFSEVYSQHTSADGMGDLQCMQLRVGFYICSTNVTLQRKDFCVPIFYVTKDWQGMYMLMFEHTNGKVYYYTLSSTKEGYFPKFPLSDCYSQAQFHLQILNAGNWNKSHISLDNQYAVEEIWCKISISPLDVDNLDSPMNKKRKLDTGSDGILHFISEWLLVTWQFMRCIQLPVFISVGRDIRHRNGAHLKGHTALLSGQLLSTVDFLHSELMVAHMDIKPDNLVLDVKTYSRPILKIINFNISITTNAHLKASLTCGTKGYMAPELQEGRLYYPFLADLYSCGICMGELLAWRALSKQIALTATRPLESLQKSYAATLPRTVLCCGSTCNTPEES